MGLRVEVNVLLNIIEKLFEFHGLNKVDSGIAAKCLIGAELAGISTHGVSMVPAHIKRCNNGYNVDAVLDIKRETDAFSICDANNAVGMVSAWHCMELAIKKAEKSGLHVVLCNNANTFSAAYCYAKYAVECGKIAIIMCNSPAQMAPLGGCEKILGTNPLAIGVPAKLEKPFILDMATSAVAKSKINEAFHNGQTKIPLGWATDINGVPTENPREAIKGMVLPMAGAKGYGLSMAIDIISGLLSHASYLDSVEKFYSSDNKCMNVGHVFAVIDPVQLYGEDFYDDMDHYLKRIRTSKTVSDECIFVPGDLNALKQEELMEKGIDISESLFNEIQQMAIEMGETFSINE